jgi:hypothetical protein
MLIEFEPSNPVFERPKTNTLFVSTYFIYEKQFNGGDYELEVLAFLCLFVVVFDDVVSQSVCTLPLKYYSYFQFSKITWDGQWKSSLSLHVCQPRHVNNQFPFPRGQRWSTQIAG